MQRLLKNIGWLLTGRGLAFFAFALAYATVLVLAEAETRQVDLRQRDRHVVLALLANQLAGADELLEVALDAALHDVTEPRVILVDSTYGHDYSSLVSPRAKIDAT